MTYAELPERLERVRDAIAQAVARRGPGPEPVLVAVSKKHPVEAILAGLAAGLSDFGENYAQELRDKRRELDDPGVRWHYIGPLQSNKAKYVVGAHLVHSVDRASILGALDERADKAEHDQDVLLQVNVAREPQKAGADPDAVPELLDRFADLRRVRCRGLMLIPPIGSAEDTRHWFRELARLRDRHAGQQRARVDLSELSMGMSSDFTVAIEEGATLIRVGTAIFGPRPS